MEGIADWLAKITWPLVSRVLASLGVGTVTYTGASTALESAIGNIKAGFMGMTGDILQLMTLAGFFDAMAIMSGGITSALAWMVMKRFALQTTGQGA